MEMTRKISSLLIVLCSLGHTSGCLAAEASNWTIGEWEAAARSMSDRTIVVTDAHVKIDSCAPVPYNLLSSGIAAVPRDLDEWHEFVLELQPRTDAEARCIGARVLLFAIPASLVCHADITRFKDRASFEAHNYSGRDGWGKRRC
jgi:hypothetical protein